MLDSWAAEAEERLSASDAAARLADLVAAHASIKAKSLTGLHIRARMKDSFKTLAK